MCTLTHTNTLTHTYTHTHTLSLSLSFSLSLSTGRAWTAADLRTKSWDDLHALWYVLLKERARLDASADAARSARVRPANPARAAKVRKSMARIKLVLSERASAHPEPVTRYELRCFVDAL